MKKVLFLLCLLIAGSVSAGFLGVKQSSETISFFLNKPLDSLYGIPRSPDSVHVFTYADNATAQTFAARSTTFPFSDISIDTLKHYTDTMFVFADLISDIDGAGGNFSLAIEVQMYYDDIPTTTHAVVQIIADSLSEFAKTSELLVATDNIGINWGDVSNQSTSVNLSATTTNLVNTATTVTGGATSANQTLIIDTVNGIIDTLQNQDDWVAKEASLFDNTTDDVTLSDGEFAIVADSVWQADTLNHNGVVGSFGEFLYKPQTASVSDADMGSIADSVWQRDTTVSTASSYGVLLKDTSAYQGDFVSNQTLIVDTVNAILDTLQNQDNWVAKEASLFDGDLSALGTLANQTLIIDTVNGIIDTLQNQDNWVAKEASLFDGDLSALGTLVNQTLIIDTVNGIIDTLQNQDNWVGTSANQTLIIDTVNAILDTLQLQDGWITRATQIDTLLMYMGYNSTSSRSTNGTDTETDTLHIFEGATEIRRLLFWHIGGAAGDAPDSVTVAL